MAKTQAELLKEALAGMSAQELQVFLEQKKNEEGLAKSVEHNVVVEVNDNIVTLKIDMNKTVGFTSGGNTAVATTKGALKIGDVYIAVNAYKKDNKKK